MNGIKTGFLLAALTALLLFIGYVLGGFGGLIIFLIIAAVMNFSAFWWSDKFALRMAGAREVSAEEAPGLHDDGRGGGVPREHADAEGLHHREPHAQRFRHGTQPGEGRGGGHDRRHEVAQRARAAGGDRPRGWRT